MFMFNVLSFKRRKPFCGLWQYVLSRMSDKMKSDPNLVEIFNTGIIAGISGNELSRSISTGKQHQNNVQMDQFNPYFTLIQIKGIGFLGRQNTPTGC